MDYLNQWRFNLYFFPPFVLGLGVGVGVGVGLGVGVGVDVGCGNMGLAGTCGNFDAIVRLATSVGLGIN